MTPAVATPTATAGVPRRRASSANPRVRAATASTSSASLASGVATRSPAIGLASAPTSAPLIQLPPMSIATTTGLPLRGVDTSVTEALSASGVEDVGVVHRNRHLDLVADDGEVACVGSGHQPQRRWPTGSVDMDPGVGSGVLHEVD